MERGDRGFICGSNLSICIERLRKITENLRSGQRVPEARSESGNSEYETVVPKIELCNLYSSPNRIKSRRMRWARHVARMGRRRMHTGYWWESQKEKRPLERPRRRWVDTNKMDLREMG
jgi:hypothetical protein